MKTIYADDLSEQEIYKVFTGTISPRPVAFVTTQSEAGVLNAAPFSFFNIVASNPPVLAISVQRKAGQLKDTARNILENNEFVIHLVDELNVGEVNQTAANLSYGESELDLTHLSQVESDVIAVAGVNEAKVRFECRLKDHLEIKNGDKTSADLILGEVLAFHLAETVVDKNLYTDYEALKPVSRLAGQDYAKLGERFKLIRPK